MTSPATMYVTLLTAASHYCAVHGLLAPQLPTSNSNPTPTPNSNINNIKTILLNLKQATLESIGNEIRQTQSSNQTHNQTQSSNPHQPIPDTVIGAVTKMASYEAMFGTNDQHAFRTHMRGLAGMIKSRGGLEMLGLDGLLMRMVLWVDINAAFMTGGKTWFQAGRPLAGHTASREPGSGDFLSEFGRDRVGGQRGQMGTQQSTSATTGSGASEGANLDTIDQHCRDYLAAIGQSSTPTSTSSSSSSSTSTRKKANIWTACGGNIAIRTRSA